MNSDTMSVVGRLHAEIRDMELTIAYLEGGIARKRIAIAEIMSGAACKDPLPPKRTIEIPSEDVRLSMLSMCRFVVGLFGSEPFSFEDAKVKMEERFPGRRKFYRRSTFYAAFKSLQQDGVIAPVPAGFIRTAKSLEQTTNQQ